MVSLNICLIQHLFFFQINVFDQSNDDQNPKKSANLHFGDRRRTRSTPNSLEKNIYKVSDDAKRKKKSFITIQDKKVGKVLKGIKLRTRSYFNTRNEIEAASDSAKCRTKSLFNSQSIKECDKKVDKVSDLPKRRTRSSFITPDMDIDIVSDGTKSRTKSFPTAKSKKVGKIIRDSKLQTRSSFVTQNKIADKISDGAKRKIKNSSNSQNRIIDKVSNGSKRRTKSSSNTENRMMNNVKNLQTGDPQDTVLQTLMSSKPSRNVAQNSNLNTLSFRRLSFSPSVLSTPQYPLTPRGHQSSSVTIPFQSQANPDAYRPHYSCMSNCPTFKTDNSITSDTQTLSLPVEEDEALGTKATKAAVLYTNIHNPNLRIDNPCKFNVF